MRHERGSTDPVRYPELLIRIAPGRGTAHTVELEYTAPGADASTEAGRGQATFDLAELSQVIDDVEEYGSLLTRSLFAERSVKEGFDRACAISETLQIPLRLRLQIDAEAPELHALRWELLRDSRGDALATSERILLSRYLRSPSWRPIRQRPEARLRALVMVANPSELDRFPTGDASRSPLASLDVEEDVDRATEALGNSDITVLASRGAATLEALIEHLRRGYDVVYLVCHGAMHRGKAQLYLEDELGDVDVVTGADLAREMDRLRQFPTLMVLASCESAGSGTPDALAAMGPLLSHLGVPAVLAMQGKIRPQTSRDFMGQFFAQLRQDGQIDRAAAVARDGIKTQPDAWMPVLFTRLPSGRLWSQARDVAASDFILWPALLDRIERGRCTPILGPGLIEFLLGSPRQVAQRWADEYRFPMAPHQRHDLPQVAQYLAVFQKDPELPGHSLKTMSTTSSGTGTARTYPRASRVRQVGSWSTRSGGSVVSRTRQNRTAYCRVCRSRSTSRQTRTT